MHTTMAYPRNNLRFFLYVGCICAASSLSSGCGRAPAPPPLPQQSFPIPAGNDLVLEVDQGTLTVYGHGEPDLRITAGLSLPGSLVEHADLSGKGESRFEVSNAAASGTRDWLEVGIPAGVPVHIVQEKGVLNISDLDGELSVQSSSAGIHIERFKGKSLRREQARPD